MKRMKGFELLVSGVAAIWLLTGFAAAHAQGKGQAKNTSRKERKKNEQLVGKENRGTGRTTDTPKAAKTNKNKYKPRGISAREMSDWPDGNPPGWSHGNKTGWGGAGVPPGRMKERELEIAHSYPPGSADWDSQKKADWQHNLEQSKTRILERIRTRKGMTREDEERATISIERTAREGVPLTHIESAVNKAINREMRGNEIEKITRAMSYGADKNTDYERLNQFIERKMNAGETGDDLAVSIYKEIDERHTARIQQPERKSWWNRLFSK
ncbi:MAG: hypothetical protein U5O15_00625 [Candidatus Krumholzibacteriota bacterium]|nr:hypothetical protein [Candidatus Krumholzibacteriota bacterium]